MKENKHFEPATAIQDEVSEQKESKPTPAENKSPRENSLRSLDQNEFVGNPEDNLNFETNTESKKATRKELIREDERKIRRQQDKLNKQEQSRKPSPAGPPRSTEPDGKESPKKVEEEEIKESKKADKDEDEAKSDDSNEQSKEEDSPKSSKSQKVFRNEFEVRLESLNDELSTSVDSFQSEIGKFNTNLSSVLAKIQNDFSNIKT